MSKLNFSDISKEELTKLYCEDLLSLSDLSEHYNKCQSSIKKYIEYFGLTRDKEAVRLKSYLATTSASHEKEKELIDRDKLYNYYIIENHTYEECQRFFDLTTYKLDKLLSEYGIHKDKSISAKLGLATKYDNAGSRDKYFENINSKRNDTKVNKYGSLEAAYASVSQKCQAAWDNKSAEEKAEISYRTMSHGGGWNKETILATLKSRYDVDNAYKLASAFNTNSKPNNSFADKLSATGISFVREFQLGHYRFDFCCDKTLIEIDPWPFHNISWTPLERATPVSKFYHRDKSAVAEQNNYRCIHIFDWDDDSKIIELLKNRPRCYARQCEIREVAKEDAKSYLNTYHLQGYARDEIRLGLYLKNQLISIMTFGKPRYNKNYEYELIRYCSHYQIVGGAEKLFTYFTRNFDVNSMISYCDRAKFQGDVYSKLGFAFIRKSEPAKHWYNIKTGDHVTDNLLRQRGFDQLFSTDYGKGTSNEELMLSAGFVEIYDCGQSIYSWKRDSDI